ncbi:aldehyde dehydrogenase family protein, partial [Billgrantia antri]|uniref:aldehyde dehydrogenase family protein n=1 Tax=Billgrantia antri TaxID=2846777 RepID=UPI003B218481
VAADSGDTFESRNPATGELLAQVASCDEPDAERAVAAARHAFAGGAWSRLAPGKRKKTLLRLAELMETHKHELAL